MIKLKELTRGIENWYLSKVKEEILKRIKECKSIFEEDFKLVNNSETLKKFEEIEKNIKKYLIEKPDINLVLTSELDKEINFSFEIGKILKIKAKKLELIEEYNKMCSLLSHQELFLEKNIHLKEVKEKVKNLNIKLKILKKIFNKKNIQEKQEKNKLKLEHFFKYIFDYDILSEKKEDKIVLRHLLLSKMNVKTCPYCDRNYITSYSNVYSTADLDHFYPQSDYPYLALNIYNFIPACAICNRNLKKSKKIEINPREEEFGEDATFTLENKIDTYLNMELKDIDITINIKNESYLKEKIKTNIEVFKLKEIYKIHSDYVFQMIRDIRFRGNENYLKSIEEIFQEERSKILKELILKPYKFKIENNEPLGKLTKDILKEILGDE